MLEEATWTKHQKYFAFREVESCVVGISKLSLSSLLLCVCACAPCTDQRRALWSWSSPSTFMLVLGIELRVASTRWDIFLCTFPYNRVQGYLPSRLLAMSIQMPSHVFTSTSSYWTLFIKMKSISQWLKIDYLGTQEWWVLKFTSVGCGHKVSAVELGAVSK